MTTPVLDGVPQDNGSLPNDMTECTVGVEFSRFERRAPVQADGGPRPEHPAGTLAWAEFEEAWVKYAERMHDLEATIPIDDLVALGGFNWFELAYYLGHEPTTWEPK